MEYMLLEMQGDVAIDGETTLTGFDNCIEVLSYSHHLNQAGGASVSRTTGQTGSRVDIGDFSIVKVLDKATPNLALFCCSGKHIPTVVLEICAASEDKVTYMKYTMSDAVIASVRPGGSANGEGVRPLEEVSFRFAKIEWEYTPFGNDGKPGAALKAGWDAATNKKV